MKAIHTLLFALVCLFPAALVVGKERRQQQQQQQQDDEAEQVVNSSSSSRKRRRGLGVDMSEHWIIGGKQVKDDPENKFPYYVHTGQCGGSLVAPDVVLCAAHCYGTIKYEVMVGAVNYKNEKVGDAQKRAVISKVKHPKYKSTAKPWDFMLIKIEKVTKPHLVPVKLNLKNSLPKKGQKLTVIGAGAIDAAGEKYEPHLKWVNVDATSTEECQQKYGEDRYGKPLIQKQSMVCAMAEGVDSCYGDSGGPLLTEDGVQVGVVSFGAGCSDAYWPGVYARVSGASFWLQKTICDLTDYPDPGYCKRKTPAAKPPPKKEPVTFTVTIQYDNSPESVSWYIKDIRSKKTLVSVPKGRVTKAKTTLMKRVALQPGGKYMLMMQDSQRNGFTAGKNGFMSIVGKRSGQIVFNKKISGRFKAMKIIKFSVPKSLK